MKSSARPLFVGAAVAFFFTITLAAFAQEQPAPSPVAAPSAESTPAVAPAAPAPATAAVTPEAEKPVAVEKSTLRRIDGDEPAALAPSTPAPAPSGKKTNGRVVRKKTGNNDYVRFAEDVHIESGNKIEGDVSGIFGDVLVDGDVEGDVISVGGDITINGTVHGDVGAIFGSVTLGPKAVVDGGVRTVNGDTHRDAGASVGGKISTSTDGKRSAGHGPVPLWGQHALGGGGGGFLGLGLELRWLWLFSVVCLVFYVMIALVFPGGVRRTGDMLVQRPAAVVLSALLTLIALPVLFVLLLITIIGIPVALLALPAGVFLGVAFGETAIYALVGRAATKDKFPVAVSVLIGGGVFILFYLVPVLGLALSLLVSVVGLGCAVTALLSAGKKPAPSAPRSNPVVPPMAPAATMPVGDASAGFSAPAGDFAASVPLVTPIAVESASATPQSAGFGAADPITPPFAPLTPPVFDSMPEALPPKLPGTPNATLPRAGFWIRTGAVLIDLVLIAMIFGPAGAGGLILPGLAAYGAVMWKFKGTTIGGVVCGLRVVRLDDRPLDWATTVVRALGCFLSLVVGGLGFVWVVFDSERQSWHDKIAGTVVVRSPKGTSLV
ncbi:MAG: RDD family protein [Undibacterium sp.]|nr:RDD family protein [Opitutaceae bacterium]